MLGKQISLTKKYILECSSHQSWDALKNFKKLEKTFNLLSNTWTLFFKLPQILGPIQVFANNLKKHDYNNLPFESPCKQEWRNNVPNFFLLFP